jgi:FkbM family methyltransferase
LRLPIVAGPLLGRWWLPQSRGKILRILGGTYEPEQTRLFQKHVTQGATVLDVGAHVGYYTLLASVLVGPNGRVCAFEPNPENHGFLCKHVLLNELTNVTMENAAVSNSNGTASFAFGTGSGTGRLAEHGVLDVRTVRLDDFCRERKVEPDFLKIDVEGAELDVLRGADEVIRSHHPVIFLSTHGEDVHGECLVWLGDRGYTLLPVAGTDLDSATEILCT